MCNHCNTHPCTCPLPHAIVIAIFDAVLKRDDVAMKHALELEKRLRDKYPDRLWCWAFSDTLEMIRMRQRKSA